MNSKITESSKTIAELDAHIASLDDEYLYDLLIKVQSGSPMSLQEIADLMGLSRERVRQIQEKAFRKLRRNRKAMAVLKSYLADMPD